MRPRVHPGLLIQESWTSLQSCSGCGALAKAVVAASAALDITRNELLVRTSGAVNLGAAVSPEAEQVVFGGVRDGVHGGVRHCVCGGVRGGVRGGVCGGVRVERKADGQSAHRTHQGQNCNQSTICSIFFF